MKGPSLRIIANAGHYVMREQAEAVNIGIDDWLNKPIPLDAQGWLMLQYVQQFFSIAFA
ncbi:MAG: hypothetical protein NVS4B7_10630 [Ktedonobacteraceae bacterium]